MLKKTMENKSWVYTDGTDNCNRYSRYLGVDSNS